MLNLVVLPSLKYFFLLLPKLFHKKPSFRWGGTDQDLVQTPTTIIERKKERRSPTDAVMTDIETQTENGIVEEEEKVCVHIRSSTFTESEHMKNDNNLFVLYTL
ncbi:hypothetical protein B9Z55_000133 [Caenorhabditis nigoni]|uniref:Uncharacterized protein n=1 Tax=Caenorhabditis nigoni TaxID=1611254 RepID=A0A2G5VFG6_9PELO|nr:hypothetical protein B9Z55_000133 [Caenorhabditis nigoni]